MRTTLTLDDDVAEKLRAESRRSGKPLKQIVNEYLRLGLNACRTPKEVPPFIVKAYPMGLHEGLNYDDVGELLERIEGPTAR